MIVAPSSTPSVAIPSSCSNMGAPAASSGLKRMRVSISPPEVTIAVQDGRGGSSSCFGSSSNKCSSSGSCKRVRFSQCERPPVDLTHIVIGALVLALFMCAREWRAILSEDYSNDIFIHRLAMRNLSVRFWGCFRPVCAGIFALILLWIVSCGWQSLSIQKMRRK